MSNDRVAPVLFSMLFASACGASHDPAPCCNESDGSSVTDGALCCVDAGEVALPAADGAVIADGGAPPPSPSECVPISSRHYDPTEVPAAPIGSGAVWFVDGKNGKDSNDGKSEATAWQTIGHAVSGGSVPLQPGDTVRIKKGLYREQVGDFRKGGTSAARIIVGAFGDGEVIVDASKAVTGWTLVAGQIYKATPGFQPRAVVIDDVPLLPESSQGALVAGRWFFDGTSLYVWAPAGGSPDAHDLGVVVDDEYQTGFNVNGASYVTLYGLTVRFSGGHGISVLGDHVRVEKCKARFNGKSGINLYGYQAVTTVDAQIVKNDIYHNVIRNWPRGRYKSGGWAAGLGSNATPAPLYQGNVSHKNGGEGMLNYAGTGGTIYRDNVVYDNWSVNIYNDNQPNSVIENNFVFCHDPDPMDLHNNGDPSPSDNQNLKRLRADGILTADESYGLTPPANLANVRISNNVILNCRHGIGHYADATGSGLKNVQVLNNTIVVAANLVAGETVDTMAGISIPYNSGNNTGSVYRNNVVYGTNAGTYLLYGGTAPASTDQFTGVSVDHNVWFHTSRATPLHWGVDYHNTYDFSLTAWLALPGGAHGAGDQGLDPGFIDPTTLELLDKRAAAASSPLVDHGVDVGAATDYNFCARPVGAAVDVGAFEFGAAAP